MHSGPVTAGVLRGDRARFQLFGDTMNTASRMESTGMKDKIQLSQETVDLLQAAGKGSWVVPREDLIVAKGKGELHTYWLRTNQFEKNRSPYTDGTESDQLGQLDSMPAIEIDVSSISSDKVSRLIQWNVEVLTTLLKRIEGGRDLAAAPQPQLRDESWPSDDKSTVLEKVKEIVHLPQRRSRLFQEPETVQLSKEVHSELVR
jgi:hypothetical protein